MYHGRHEAQVIHTVVVEALEVWDTLCTAIVRSLFDAEPLFSYDKIGSKSERLYSVRENKVPKQKIEAIQRLLSQDFQSS